MIAEPYCCTVGVHVSVTEYFCDPTEVTADFFTPIGTDVVKSTILFRAKDMHRNDS